MKKKIVLTLALLTMLTLCLAVLTACGNCEHPTESLEYSQNGGHVHGVYCNACNNYLFEERCDTPDGKCGLCAKCGYEGSHEYVPNGESTDATHTVRCSRCDDIKEEAHSLYTFGGRGAVTYHDLSQQCYACGYSNKILGDHASASGTWQTNATSHWQICDECEGEFKFGIHDLADGACTACDYAADALPVSENLEFTLSDDESYYILTKILVKGDDEAVIIVPATYNDKPVKVIGKGGTGYAERSLVDGMRAVKALYIPDGVTTVSDYAFGSTNYAVGLVYLRLPETLTYIGDWAFRCADLYELTVPAAPGNANRIIGTGAFLKNDELRSLVIEEGVTIIEGNAFEGCRMLTNVSLPSTAADIADNAFKDCDNIKTLTVQSEDGANGNGNDHYLVIDNCLIERGTMTLIRSNDSMTVPTGVKVLSQCALSGYGGFYTDYSDDEKDKHVLTLPRSLEVIEQSAFENPSVTGITLSGNHAIFATGTGCLYNKETATLLWGNTSCVIPENVTAIAQNAFSHRTFDQFTIPAHIKQMEQRAFEDCHFNELTIEAGVGGVGFNGCATEQEVLTVPGSVKSIDNFGIGGMKKLVLCEGVESVVSSIHVEVVLPTTLKSVGENVRYAEDDINISVYEGCEYFGDASNPYYALLCPDGECGGTLKIHPDTKIIADKAFNNRNELTDIVFNDKLAYIGKYAFAYTCLSGEIVIPDSVKGIGDGAFYNVHGSAFALTLSNGIEEFGEHMIDTSSYSYDNFTKYGNYYYLGSTTNPYLVAVQCNNTGDITEWRLHADTKAILCTPGYPTVFEGTTAQWSKVYKCDLFYDHVNENWNDPSFTCSDGKVDLYGATYGLQFTSSQNYPNTYAVARGTATGNIVIPEIYKGRPVSEIASWGFSNTAITSVTLPDSIRKIGKNAFSGSAITAVVIPDSVEIIDESAFSSCSDLASVTLGKGVKRIEAFAFDSTAITALTLPAGLEYINSYAIVRCDALALNEYDNAYYLGSASNPHLALVKVKDASKSTCTIHENTVMILNNAFYGSSITSVVIPDSVVSIQTRAFQDCDRLASVTLGKGITVLDDGQFLSCEALTSLEIRGEMTTIGFQSFSNCKNLKNITLPATIEVLEGTSFEKSYIDQSTVITYAGTVAQWEQLMETNGLAGQYSMFWSVGKVICSDGEINCGA